MNVTIDLKPEIQAGLMAQAQSSGKTLEEYLVWMVEGAVGSVQVVLTAEERAAAFEACSASHRHTPPLSDYAVSRDSIYEGRNG